MLTWMIEIRMKNHLVSDSNCQHHKSIIPQKTYKETTNNVELTFSFGDTIVFSVV